MKLKNISRTIKLEQLYASSGITEPEAKWTDTKDEDVPFGPQQHDKEYKTSIPFPPMSEDVEEPELKTKKGKNILREPPGDPDAKPDDIDVDMYNKDGKEIDDWDDWDDWDDSDTGIISEQNKNKEDNDKAEMEKFAKDNLGEENEDDTDTQGQVEDPDAPPQDDIDPQDLADDQGQVDPNTGMPVDQGQMDQQQVQVDPNTGMPVDQQQGQADQQGAVDPNTGMPMGQGQVDPNTGMPMDQQQSAIDPNTGMPMDQGGGMGMGQGSVDPNTGMPMDQSGMGMGWEKPKTPEVIGRIFELKKIYTRLLSIDSQLSFSSDNVLIRLRKFISQAIELFEIVIANEKSFENDIDEIIVVFYEFLAQVYDIIQKYYKLKENLEQKNKDK